MPKDGPGIPVTIQVTILINREAIGKGEPPMGLLAVHNDGLPDDAALLDEVVLEWADKNGIRRPNPILGELDKRRFHEQIVKIVHEWAKNLPPGYK